jgi:hypothetical protein
MLCCGHTKAKDVAAGYKFCKKHVISAVTNHVDDIKPLLIFQTKNPRHRSLAIYKV